MYTHNRIVSLLVGIFLAGAGSGRAASSPRPNLVVILADDMGFSDLGCYGGEISTPNLDRLAKDGLRYTRFYNCSRCCPSRASLMTGLYPHQAGVGDMVDEYAAGVRARLNSRAYEDHLSAQAPTIAEVLRPAGYGTLMSGKWHLGYRPPEWPAARGFEHSFAQIQGAMNYYGYGPQHLLPQGERGYVAMARDDKAFTPPQQGFFTTDAYTDYAIEQVKTQAASGKPFFLYLAYNAPHWPLQARPETIAKYRHAYDAGWDAVRQTRHARLQELGIIGRQCPLAPRPPRLAAWEKLLPEKRKQWQEWMSVYAAQVEELDAGIGRFLSTLRETGLESNTVVMFFSDNGGAAERPVKTISKAALGTQDSYEGYDLEGAHVSCAPLRRTKSFAHEGGISSPLIVRWPAGIASERNGMLVKDVVHIMDIMPSCIELAGARRPDKWGGGPAVALEGESLAPTFAGKAPKRSGPLCWEHEGNRALLDGKWKLVGERGDAWELYDLESDRTESHNLAEAQPERVRELAGRYEAWMRRAGVLPWPEQRNGKNR
jgi:arylsulfatase